MQSDNLVLEKVKNSLVKENKHLHDKIDKLNVILYAPKYKNHSTRVSALRREFTNIKRIKEEIENARLNIENTH